MRKRFVLIAVLSFAVSAHAAIDRAAAQRAFDAFRINCHRDDGKLWRATLCGTVVIVDRSTREAVDSEGRSGTLPDSFGIANTAFDWHGTRASMVMWPLPDDVAARDRLLLHERFHAIQDGVGLPMSPPSANAHLDTLRGRYLMRLEMRALRAAMVAKSKADEKRAVGDALEFRRERFNEFPDAATAESALDRNEGMAEYTGLRLSMTDRPKMKELAALGLESGEKADSFERTYAYATGPAWGLVLDDFVPEWRHQIASKRYDELISLDRYDAATVLQEETKRDDERRARVASYEKRFIEGPVLTLPLHNMNMQMNPYDTHPFGERGTVYEHITVSDDWGRIVVGSGAWISSDFKTLTVALPDGATPQGLTLASGWRVTAGKRAGDLTVQRVDR